MTDLDTVTPCPVPTVQWPETFSVEAADIEMRSSMSCWLGNQTTTALWLVMATSGWVQVSVLDNVTMLCLLWTLNNVLCLETAVPAYRHHNTSTLQSLHAQAIGLTNGKQQRRNHHNYHRVSMFSWCPPKLESHCRNTPGCVMAGEDDVRWRAAELVLQTDPSVKLYKVTSDGQVG